jgi:type III pantothenate kinase
MNLLIDMGNTRLKWAVTTGGQLMTGQFLVNSWINRDELIRHWKGLYHPRRIAISCVSANQLLELVLTVAQQLWLDVEIIQVKSQAQAFGVINSYPQPQKLGVDRWLALVAVWQKHHDSACIVDCGTAITVDLINADGHHQGGLISPGLGLMKQALGLGTEALPFNNAESDPVGAGFKPINLSLANDTEAAIDSGILMASVGLIEHVLANYEIRQLIFTGGDAELIARQLKVKSLVDPDLVLRGLLCVLEGQV